MAPPLTDKSDGTGNSILAAHMNDIKDYIEDAAYAVNTQAVKVGGTTVIDSSKNVIVPAGIHVVFDGTDGTTYLVYNSTSQKVELYVKSVKKAEWG